MAAGRLGDGGRGFDFPQGVHGRVGVADPVGKIAFMFPGQGSQRVGMLGHVGRDWSGAQRVWAVADAELAGRLPKLLSHYVYPPGGDEVNTVDEAALTETNVAQPAVGVVDTLLALVFRGLGLTPDMCVGHSYGEYAALHAAETLGFQDLVVLSEARGTAIRDAAKSSAGAMLAVGASGEAVEQLVEGIADVSIANLNGPTQTVVSGAKDGIEMVRERCADGGLRAVRLNVGAAFHSPLVAEARVPLLAALDDVPFLPPRIPVYANTTGEPHSVEPESIKAMLGEHLTMPVRFRDCIVNMHRDGARIFLESGPGNALSSLATQILRGTDATVVPVDHKDGWFGVLDAVARLYVLGVDGPAERLRELLRRDGSPCKNEQVAESDDRNQRHVANTGAMAEMERTDQTVEAAMRRHQRLMKLFLEGQERIMSRYLRQTDMSPKRIPDRQPRVQVHPTASVKEERSKSPLDQMAAELGSGEQPEETRVLAGLRNILADSTGFPSDMLDADLELEADLGIDSIKRVEILVEAQRRFPDLGDALDDERTRVFSRLPTLSQMAAYLESIRSSAPKLSSAGTSCSEERRSTEGAKPGSARSTRMADAGDEASSSRQIRRSMLRLVPASPASGRPHNRSGTVLLSGGDAPFLQATARKLPNGLKPMVLECGFGESGGQPTGPKVVDSIAGYVHFAMLPPVTVGDLQDRYASAEVDLLAFAANLKALERPLRSTGGVVAVAGRFGLDSHNNGNRFDPFSCGTLGLLKSIAREWPEVRCRAVDFVGDMCETDVASILGVELATDDGVLEAAHADRRYEVECSARSVDLGAVAEPLLEPHDIVVVTGGARGITGEAVVALAERWQPTLVLIGRTSLEDEDSRYEGLADMAALKSRITDVLREDGETPDVSRIEHEYALLIRRREIRRNLRRIREAGAEAHYLAADVGDRASLENALEGILKAHSRIDGVVHGAGVREDRLLGDKDAASFERVLRPKVNGALALIDALDLDRLKLMCFFSSTAARYGSAGQGDYAAANEILNGLARWLDGYTAARVVSINWGPWEPGVGMVDQALANRFRSMGVPLIPRERGVEAFVEELQFGAKGDVEVVYE